MYWFETSWLFLNIKTKNVTHCLRCLLASYLLPSWPLEKRREFWKWSYDLPDVQKKGGIKRMIQYLLYCSFVMEPRLSISGFFENWDQYVCAKYKAISERYQGAEKYILTSWSWAVPSSGKIELATHLLKAKLAEFLAVYNIHWLSRIAFSIKWI